MREDILNKISNLTKLTLEFDDWDNESCGMKEVEIDDTWKLVLLQDDGFQTIKIQRRLTR